MVYLTAAMTVIWVLAFGYLVYLVQRTRRLEQEIAMLADLVREDEQKS